MYPPVRPTIILNNFVEISTSLVVGRLMGSMWWLILKECIQEVTKLREPNLVVQTSFESNIQPSFHFQIYMTGIYQAPSIQLLFHPVMCMKWKGFQETVGHEMES
jgi:hypothetical protein